MADEELTSNVIDALIDREYERTRESLRELSIMQSSFGPGVFYVALGLNQMLFENEGLARRIIPDFLVDTISKPADSAGKLKRYHGLAHYLLSPKNFLSSLPMQIVQSLLPFLKDGIKVGVNDSDGHEVAWSLDYVRESVLKIADELEGFAAVTARYADGMKDAFKVARANMITHEEARGGLETFVRNPRAETYALMRALPPKTDSLFAGNLESDQEELKQRYDDFAKRYLTGPDMFSSQYSHIMTTPFDLLLTTSRAIVRVVGNEKQFSGIIRLLFQREPADYDLMEQLKGSANIDEEMRGSAYRLAETADEIIGNMVRLQREYINLSFKKMHERNLELIDLHGKREYQREIVERYAR